MGAIRLGTVDTIPILDFAPFVDGSRKEEVAKEILESFQTIGFVYLVNHGLPRDKVSRMFEWSRRFFAQPLEVKQLAPHPASGAHHRGYSAQGLEKVTRLPTGDEAFKATTPHRAIPDVKESFESGSEENESQPNIWLPDGVLPGFREQCLDFFWEMRKIELTILRALAIGLKLPEEYFTPYHSTAENQLRLLHYPSVPTAALEAEEITRIGAHTDFDTITLLLQDDVGGLEVEDPQTPGKFTSAAPVLDAIVLNAGDFLMRWSNDTIRSTVHRVRAPPAKISEDGMTPERYSIPYFCAADMSTVVECLPGTFSDDKPKKYKPTSVGAYIMERLAANY